MPEDEQWRAVDTLCTAFNYFYNGKKISYQQILPLEKLWAEHLDGITGVAEQPISAAITKGLIDQTKPEDLKILPNQTIETLLNRKYFFGDADYQLFSLNLLLSISTTFIAP